jgi:hypothetical protein
LHIHAISGNAVGTAAASNQLRTPYVFVAGNADWLSAEISSLNLGLLPSGLDMTGPTYAYAHSSNGVDNHLNLLGLKAENTITPVDAATPAESYIFSSLHFENGSQALFGAPFGGRVID